MTMSAPVSRTIVRLVRGLFWLLLCCAAFPAMAQGGRDGLSDQAIAEVAQRAMAEFQVPGMAVGLVQGGRTLHAAGYGVREQGKSGRVDSRTLFKIASNTKAFTTAALAVLVDEGKVSWDGRVIDYIPEFRLSDPWVTSEFTVSDLLTHRSGLPRFVGDLLLWPEPNRFTPADVIHALRYFRLVSGFRTKYAYDNLLYIVAGQIVPRVSGEGWGDFVDRRIMRPLGMKRCFAGTIPRRQMHNLAAPHGMVGGELTVIERSRIRREPPVSASAGGVVCSLGDMLTWVKTQLGRGTSPDGVQLFSEERSRELWSPQIWRSVSDRSHDLHNTHFAAYGLGWRLRDIQGYREVAHTGTLAGMLSTVVMIPELDLGIVVLTNGSNSGARTAMALTLEYAFLPAGQRDWVETVKQLAREDRARERSTAERAVPDAARCASAPREPAAYAGLYRDPWFGDVQISEKAGGLYFSALKSPKLSGPMEHYAGDVFLVHWADRTVEMDAFVTFRVDGAGRAQAMSMNREYEHTERSLDFQDLDFRRVE